MKDLDQSSRSSKRVHVQLPAKVAYDLGAFAKVQKDILGRLGCLACCSGWDIRWDIENRFVVGEDLNISGGL